MGNDTLYFLRVSGTINIGKHREFQQTVQFIFNHLSSECLSHSLSLDVHQTNLYHFYSLWSSENSLRSFRESHSFDLLKGAFQTLGSYDDSMAGSKASFQLFELNHLDN
jgi:hypothetical protein